MALTMKQLTNLLDGMEFRYFLDPKRDALMLNVSGMHGRIQFVILLEMEGTFLQFRSISYLTCPKNNPHLAKVLEVIGDLDFQLRIIKFGLDPSDGEIVAYADMWVADGTVTQEQFKQTLFSYVRALDTNFERLRKTIETGVDPGRVNPEAILKKLLDDAGLPPEVRKNLEEIAREKAKEKGKKEQPDEVVRL